LRQKIPIYLLTTKKTKRKKRIIQRLKKLKLNYKIIYGLDAKNVKDQKLLIKNYNKTEAIKNANRELSFYDIACADGHLKIYKEIVKNKIKSAIIIEDDCFLSKKIYQWVRINQNNFIKYDIIQFFAPDGFLSNDKLAKINNKFIIYKSASKLSTTTCYQINLKTCSYILKKTNKKVCSVADWPLNFQVDKIKQFMVLPFIACLQSNHLNTSSNSVVHLNRIKRLYIKKFLFFYNFISALYYILHIPFIFKNNINYNYYKEEYFVRKIVYLKSLFIKNYINIESILKYKIFYSKDLRVNLLK
jgi:GR25 family glycosyltransferase involved in LPS biosynthesis